MASERADWQYLQILVEGGKDDLLLDELYRACITSATFGRTLPEEKALTIDQKKLLLARRYVHQHDFDGAKSLLEEVLSQKKLSLLLQGDAEFVYGGIEQRSQNWDAAAERMERAAQTFSEAGLDYRKLRAQINQKVASASIDDYLVGDLLAIRQVAEQKGFHDLAANIYKALTSELLEAGNFKAAASYAAEAVRLYERGGLPADLMVSYCLRAIALLLIGEKTQAVEVIQRVVLSEGKVKLYHDCFQSLLLGKRPKLPQGHPLAQTVWPVSGLKENSVSGKILNCLKTGPMTRDDLITGVWGDQAVDPSYNGRLYTAIKALRKKLGQEILFDGEFYRLEG